MILGSLFFRSIILLISLCIYFLSFLIIFMIFRIHKCSNYSYLSPCLLIPSFSYFGVCFNWVLFFWPWVSCCSFTCLVTFCWILDIVHLMVLNVWIFFKFRFVFLRTGLVLIREFSYLILNLYDNLRLDHIFCHGSYAINFTIGIMLIIQRTQLSVFLIECPKWLINVLRSVWWKSKQYPAF